MTLEWETVTATMLQSKCKTYQISRGASANSSKFIYRSYHRPTNTVLCELECWNEQAERAAATMECKAACEADSVSKTGTLQGAVPVAGVKQGADTRRLVANPAET